MNLGRFYLRLFAIVELAQNRLSLIQYNCDPPKVGTPRLRSLDSFYVGFARAKNFESFVTLLRLGGFAASFSVARSIAKQLKNSNGTRPIIDLLRSERVYTARKNRLQKYVKKNKTLS